MGIRNSRSISSVIIGAMFRKTTTVPSVLCSNANIEVTSMAAKRTGTERPQRNASRREPMCTELRFAATVSVVNAICTITSVMGRGKACTASLLKTDMPAEETMYAPIEKDSSMLLGAPPPPLILAFESRPRAPGPPPAATAA